VKMSKIVVFLGIIGMGLSIPAHPFGHIGIPHHPPCIKEPETIKVTECKLVPDKSCSTESIKIGEKITGFEKGDCKEIEVCQPVHGHHGLHGYHGKRSAAPGYIHPPCEKVTKEVCKSVPVKVDVSKDIESCTAVPKEVCEEIEKVVPKVVCKTASIKH